MAPPSPASIIADGIAIGCGNHLDAARRQTGVLEPVGDRRSDGERAAQRIRARPRRMTALPERRQIAAASAVDVRPALEDHADHADRRPHAGDLEAVGASPASPSPSPTGSGRVGDLRRARGHVLEPLLVERQPVDHRGRLGDVLRIGFENVGRAAADAGRAMARMAPLRCVGRARCAGFRPRPALPGRSPPSARDSHISTRSSRWINSSGPL